MPCGDCGNADHLLTIGREHIPELTLCFEGAFHMKFCARQRAYGVANVGDRCADYGSVYCPSPTSKLNERSRGSFGRSKVGERKGMRRCASCRLDTYVNKAVQLLERFPNGLILRGDGEIGKAQRWARRRFIDRCDPFLSANDEVELVSIYLPFFTSQSSECTDSLLLGVEDGEAEHVGAGVCARAYGA